MVKPAVERLPLQHQLASFFDDGMGFEGERMHKAGLLMRVFPYVNMSSLKEVLCIRFSRVLGRTRLDWPHRQRGGGDGEAF